jgi:ketosteroid isomerase-like protein
LSVVVQALDGQGDKVAVLGTFEARGRDGMTVRRRIANVTTFREGLAVRIDAYGDWDQALDATGRQA